MVSQLSLPLANYLSDANELPLYHNLVPAQLKLVVQELAGDEPSEWGESLRQAIQPQYRFNPSKWTGQVDNTEVDWDDVLDLEAPGYELNDALEILTDRLSEEDLDVVLHVAGTLSAMLMESNIARRRSVVNTPNSIPEYASFRTTTKSSQTMTIPRMNFVLRGNNDAHLKPQLTWRQWLRQGWDLLLGNDI